MKVKRHHSSSAEGLATQLEHVATVLDTNIANGVLAQGSIALADHWRVLRVFGNLRRILPPVEACEAAASVMPARLLTRGEM